MSCSCMAAAANAVSWRVHRYHARMSEHSDSHSAAHTPLPAEDELLAQAGFATRAVHAGCPRDEYGSVTPAIYQTSTYAFRDTAHGAACFQAQAAGCIYMRLVS